MPSWLIVLLTIATTLAVVFTLSEWMVRRTRPGVAAIPLDDEELLEP